MVLDVMEPCFVFSSCCYRTFVYWWVQGVTMPGVIGIYFKFNSGDLTSTSSQICGSWNLPMFLLRDGSLTLIKIASFMFLVILLSSLPNMLKLFKGHIMTCDVLIIYDGRWCSHMFPESFSILDSIVMPQPDGSLKTTVFRNPPIQTCTYIGTVTTICLQNSVSSTPSDTERKLYIPPANY